MIKAKRILLYVALCSATYGVQANPLYPNTYLWRGQYIQSPEKKYTLIMQGDGSLVMYRADGTKRYGMAKYGQFAVMQSDGNFVEYGTSSAIWNTGHMRLSRIGYHILELDRQRNFNENHIT